MVSPVSTMSSTRRTCTALDVDLYGVDLDIAGAPITEVGLGLDGLDLGAARGRASIAQEVRAETHRAGHDGKDDGGLVGVLRGELHAESGNAIGDGPFGIEHLCDVGVLHRDAVGRELAARQRREPIFERSVGCERDV